MSMVHCDIKMANVLVENRDSQKRGILTDFDLSKDDKSRREDASFRAKSMASVVGPRGTLGALTMAPEVMDGATPDVASDCWSFGGLVLACLYKDQARSWEGASMHSKWEDDGTPVLLHMHDEDQGKQLLMSLLHKQRDKRLSSTQAVGHGFFNSNIQVLNRLSGLQEKEKELARRDQEHQALCTSTWQLLQQDTMAVEKQLEERENKIKEKETELARRGHEQQQARAAHTNALRALQEDRKALEEQQNMVAAEERRLHQEAQAVNGGFLRMPNWYKHRKGYNVVDGKYVKNIVQAFLRESGCGCVHTRRGAQVISVQRIENERLWSQYQVKKQCIMDILKDRRFNDLAGHTPQPKMPNASELSTTLNEYYL
jgi:hypothetical protein